MSGARLAEGSENNAFRGENFENRATANQREKKMGNSRGDHPSFHLALVENRPLVDNSRRPIGTAYKLTPATGWTN